MSECHTKSQVAAQKMARNVYGIHTNAHTYVNVCGLQNISHAALPPHCSLHRVTIPY